MYIIIYIHIVIYNQNVVKYILINNYIYIYIYVTINYYMCNYIYIHDLYDYIDV